MLRPNLAFILFYDQWFIVYGLVLNQNSVQSADLFVPVVKNSTIFGSQYLILPRPTWFCLKLPGSNPTCVFASQHNTTGHSWQIDSKPWPVDVIQWQGNHSLSCHSALINQRFRGAYQIGPEYVVLVKHRHWKSRKRYGLAQPNKLIK